MKQPVMIPFSRYMEMAALSGHRADDVLTGKDTSMSPKNELDYIKFAHAIAQDLQTTPIEHILLDRIVDLAKEHGYVEQDWSSLGNQVASMMHNSAWELMYTRYAYRIAAELKKPS